MKNTKKLRTLILALILALTLAACGGGSAPDPGGNQAQGNGGNDPGGNQAPDNGGNDPGGNQTPVNGGNDPGAGGNIVIPDNGTPPYVEPPLESHRGDKGYFYVTTDDYVVWTDSGDNKQLMGGIEYGDNNGITYFVASFNENGDRISGMTKYVFSSEADAAAYVDTLQMKDSYIQIGNVVYPYMLDWGDGSWNHYKDGIIEYAPHDDMYFSKP